jgi:hypothetical protein
MRCFLSALTAAVGVAGCAIEPSAPTAVVTPVRANAIATERTKDAVVVGKSTKADVVAALGETLAIRFDSGYEVWVYKLSDYASPARPTRATASDNAWPWTPPEFVILFGPSGVAAKTRIRPAS